MAIPLFPTAANSLARLRPLRLVFQSLGLEQGSNSGFYIYIKGGRTPSNILSSLPLFSNALK